MTVSTEKSCEVKSSKTKVDPEDEDKGEDNFIPPDGGWGWMIVIAAGFSNFCILPVLQSFGLIFRDRFEQLGISSSQTTSIININCAITACIGLANGPLFRKYSCRQVSFVGAVICATSITILSSMRTFTGALIFFSILYGAGTGITMSANALALNTYFKERRRVATGLSWTCTGTGPIVMPQIITLLMPIFGMQGTVLIFGGFAFNAVACSLLLQPVSWHTKGKRKEKDIKAVEEGVRKSLKEEEAMKTNGKGATNLASSFQSRSLENIAQNSILGYGALSQAKGKFGSQYLYYDDEEGGAAGIDVMGPGTPMMSRANDGWFSKRNTSSTSLQSRSYRKDISRCSSRRPSISMSRAPSLLAISRGSSVRNLNRQNSEKESGRRKLPNLQSTPIPLIILSESCEHAEGDCKEAGCVQKTEALLQPENIETDKLIEQKIAEESKGGLFHALVIFFDLDLLRDPVYVNLMLGITFANFAELNFSLMTPFILGEYGFTKIQVATVMSILAAVDVVTRLTIPFIASFIGWENRTFFLVGVCGMAAGRIVLAHVQDFSVTVAVAVLIGIGKGLRTIFMALVIPSHVPLSRLPGATGIQLLTSGIVALVFGPLVGLLRDISANFTIMLHCLNILTYLTTISWTIESCLRSRRSKKQQQKASAK